MYSCPYKALFTEEERKDLQKQARTVNGLVELVWIGESSKGSLEKYEKWLSNFYR
jgi:hypothetical protein